MAAHSAHPATDIHSALTPPANQYPASRDSLVPSGTTTGTTATGASRHSSGASSTRPCMKSPPWRIQYSACRSPLTRMNITTAAGLCTVRASGPPLVDGATVPLYRRAEGHNTRPSAANSSSGTHIT